MTLQHNYKWYEYRARFVGYSPTMRLPIYAIYKRYAFIVNKATRDPLSTLKDIKEVH